MVAPLIAAAAITAASAIAQGYQAEQARGANAKRLKELRALFESIVPPEYDISINSPPEYLKQQLGSANLDFSRLTPEQFKVVGQYSPEAAQYVAEQNPTLLKGSSAQKEGRQAQIDALRQMQSVAKGESPELSIALQRARDSSQASAQSRQQSIIDDAQRRGMGGSGLSLAAQLQGAGDAMSTGAGLSQQAAIEAYRNKLNAMQQTGVMGRQLASDELGMEQANTDIINSFNQRTSRQYQDYLSQRAQMQNQAQLTNLNMQQDVSNRNTALNNDTDRYNLENKNRLNQQSYQNTVQERNYQNSLAEQKAAWAANEKARQNQLKGQSYQDQLSRASGMGGMYQAQNAQNTQNAQDRNAMIGALGSAGAGYFSGQAQADSQAAAQKAEDERWDKYLSARYSSGGAA